MAQPPPVVFLDDENGRGQLWTKENAAGKRIIGAHNRTCPVFPSRMKVIESARSLHMTGGPKHNGFAGSGEGSDIQMNTTYWDPKHRFLVAGLTKDQRLAAINDPWKNGSEYALGCTDTTRLIFARAWSIVDPAGFLGSGNRPLQTVRADWLMERPAENSKDNSKDDWVPAEWGQLLPGGQRKPEYNGDAFAAENMIYLGSDDFFGHPYGIQNWEGFKAETNKWGTEESTTSHWRRFPRSGLQGAAAR